MKIIEPGKNTLVEFTHTCNNCGCKFMYSKYDIKHDKDGDYVNCPTCNNYINVNKHFGEIIR